VFILKKKNQLSTMIVRNGKWTNLRCILLLMKATPRRPSKIDTFSSSKAGGPV